MNAKPEPIFLDTNILVYAYDRTAGRKQDIASELVKNCWEEENGCLSLQVLQEFYVSVTRKIASPLDMQTAKQLVSDLAHWRHHIPEANDLLQAIELQQQYQLSFWDAMVLQSASALGCKQLLSEDLSHKQQFGEVQVVNPFL